MCNYLSPCNLYKKYPWWTHSESTTKATFLEPLFINKISFDCNHKKIVEYGHNIYHFINWSTIWPIYFNIFSYRLQYGENFNNFHYKHYLSILILNTYVVVFSMYCSNLSCFVLFLLMYTLNFWNERFAEMWYDICCLGCKW